MKKIIPIYKGRIDDAFDDIELNFKENELAFSYKRIEFLNGILTYIDCVTLSRSKWFSENKEIGCVKFDVKHNTFEFTTRTSISSDSVYFFDINFCIEEFK